MTSETDALGNTSYFAYDTAGNLARYTDANGRVRQYDYDTAGHVTTETWYDANSGQWSVDSGQSDASLATSHQPLATIVYERDSAGRITSESDNLSSVTYVYSDAGQITSTTQSSVGGPTVTLTYQYDADGHRTQMAALIDGTADFVDDYTYDSLGRVVSVHRHDAGGLSGTVPFTAVADLLITLAYNDSDQIVSIDRYQDGQLAVEGDYSYDGYGRLIGLVYHQGETVLNSYQWTYSDSGQWSVVGGQSDPSLATDHWPLTTSSWLPTGGLMPIHDTTGVTDALSSGGLSSLNLLTSCTSADGTAYYTYDPTGQLIGAHYSPLPSDGRGAGGEGVLPEETYSYDANGNRTSVVAGLSSVVAGLPSVVAGLPSVVAGLPTEPQTATTPVVAGLPTEPHTATYTTGPGNRLLSDGTYTYAYDAEGNRIARFVDVDADGLLDAGDTDISQYAWDARNRLTEVVHYATYAALESQLPDQVVDYLYDVENRWIGQTIDSDGDGQIDHQTRFAYDGNQIVLQFDSSSPIPNPQSPIPSLGTSDLSHRYLWQPAAVDQLLADEQLLSLSPAGEAGEGGTGSLAAYGLTQPGNVLWTLTDHLGTVRDLAEYDSTTGVTTIVNHRVYDSFGNLKSQTNAAVDCIFEFTGRPTDKATGLQNNLNRWYDTKEGRWLSEDPIEFDGRDPNVYRYCANTPASVRDPTGLYWTRDEEKYYVAYADYLKEPVLGPAGLKFSIQYQFPPSIRDADKKNSPVFVQHVSVKLTAKDTNGKLIDECSAYSGDIWLLEGPGRSRYFWVNDDIRVGKGSERGAMKLLVEKWMQRSNVASIEVNTTAEWSVFDKVQVRTYDSPGEWVDFDPNIHKADDGGGQIYFQMWKRPPGATTWTPTGPNRRKIRNYREAGEGRLLAAGWKETDVWKRDPVTKKWKGDWSITFALGNEKINEGLNKSGTVTL